MFGKPGSYLYVTGMSEINLNIEYVISMKRIFRIGNFLRFPSRMKPNFQFCLNKLYFLIFQFTVYLSKRYLKSQHQVSRCLQGIPYSVCLVHMEDMICMDNIVYKEFMIKKMEMMDIVDKVSGKYDKIIHLANLFKLDCRIL